MKCYTAITGSYDKPRNDIQVFTDCLGRSPRLASKFYKTHPHLWFQETTAWIDGNIFVLDNGGLDSLLGEADLALFKHPYRKTVREECAILKGKHDTAALQSQYGWLLDHTRLYEGGVMIRRDNPKVRRFNHRWWELIQRYSLRDQVTLPLAMRSVPGLKASIIPDNVRIHPVFRYEPRIALPISG